MLAAFLAVIVALQGLLAIGTASAPPRTEESSQSLIELQIQALPTEYPLGYPVAIRLIARNTSDAALPIKGRLSPSYGLVRIAHRRVDATEWSMFEPLAQLGRHDLTTGRYHADVLHFCINETRLRAPVKRCLAGLALQLRREHPLRVVLVGHGDAEGTCRYNDRLGLRRAQTVRRALLDAGVRAQIEVASLGERRPLDFASTSGTRDLNRRVEILIQRSNEDAGFAAPRLAPDCPHTARLGDVPVSRDD
jgi:outer membrane protein OmpA-like peptidoglycan-associated protein